MTRKEIEKELKIAEENYEKVLRELASKFREEVVIPLCKKNDFIFHDGDYFKECFDKYFKGMFIKINNKNYIYAGGFRNQREFFIPNEFSNLIEDYFPNENLKSIR